MHTTDNVVVYTDASVDQDTDPPGYASIGYMWYTKKDNEWVQTKQYSARISHTHSSFSAEGVALIEALLGYPDDQVVDKVAVFTDSKSNLQTIKRGVATQKEQIELFKVLSDMSSETDIDLYHVKAHGNILKNIAVDALCSMRENTNSISLRKWEGTRTQQKVKNWLKDWIRKEYITQTFADKDALRRESSTRQLLVEAKERNDEENIGDLYPPSFHKHLPRRIGVLLSKCRTNRFTDCNFFLNFISRKNTDKCYTCPPYKDKNGNFKRHTDDQRHVLDTCMRHSRERELMKERLGLQFKQPSHLLYTRDEKVAEALGAFLCDVEDARRKPREGNRRRGRQSTTT